MSDRGHSAFQAILLRELFTIGRALLRGDRPVPDLDVAETCPRLESFWDDSPKGLKLRILVDGEVKVPENDAWGVRGV